MKEYIISYTHSTGERSYSTTDLSELTYWIERAENDRHVVQSTIKIKTTQLHEPKGKALKTAENNVT
jgi:hypothetical protein